MKSNKSENNVQFEAQLARLDQIVKQMESGQTALDEMLTLFEEGTGLVKSCSEILKNAEQKVVLLAKTKDGEWDEQDLGSVE